MKPTRNQTIAALLAVVAVLAVAAPLQAIGPVLGELSDMRVGWVLAAVALELASCLCFVAVFRHFFPDLGPRLSRRLAWTTMGAGALLPGGGAGGLAVGGMLLTREGLATRELVRRSSALFFLTSATSVAALIVAGLALGLGIADGPGDLLHAWVPAGAAAAIVLAVLVVPLPARLQPVADGIAAARHSIARPSWRLAAAAGYLVFDVAVLWATLAAMGEPAPAVALAAGYIVGYLGSTVPIPCGIGALDAGLACALIAYGVAPAHAAAAVLVYHAIAFWVPALGGAAALVSLRARRPATAPALA